MTPFGRATEFEGSTTRFKLLCGDYDPVVNSYGVCGHRREMNLQPSEQSLLFSLTNPECAATNLLPV